MKKHIHTGIVMALLLSATLYAHPEGREWKGRKGPDLEELKSELRLTEKQTTQIKTYLEAMKKEKPSGPEDRMKRFKQMDDQINSVLTPQQRTQFEAFKAKKKAERDKVMRTHFLSRLQEDLKLTPDQHQKIETIFIQFQKDMHAIFESKPESDQLKVKLKSLHDKRDDAVKAVLNPQQLTQFDTLKAKKRNPKEGDPSPGAIDTPN